MKARIKFRKYGAMKFIGHLDIMRYFQKAMRRAEIPIAFTGGGEEVSALKARIKFRKYGAMKFIGHLDIMRYFQKAMRRAEIPIAFTGG